MVNPKIHNAIKCNYTVCNKVYEILMHCKCKYMSYLILTHTRTHLVKDTTILNCQNHMNFVMFIAVIACLI